MTRAAPAVGNKYRAVRVPCGDHAHASKLERARCFVLTLQEQRGEIHDLRRQTRWPLEVNGHLVCTYVSDFDYADSDWRPVVEDTKGVRTREYVLKRKLMLACRGITIREIDR